MFGMIFGGGKFEDIFGEVSFFRHMEAESEEAIDLTEEDSVQSVRLQNLSLALIRRLDLFIKGNIPAFIACAKRECSVLREQYFGVKLLVHIGRIYATEAKIFLSGSLSGFAEKIRRTKTQMGQMWNLIALSAEIDMLTEELDQLEEDEKEERKNLLMSMGMNQIWLLMKLEVDMMVRKVVRAVLKEKGIPKNIIKRRAHGIKLLGKLWKETPPLNEEEEEKFGFNFFEEMGEFPTSPPGANSSASTSSVHTKIFRDHAGVGAGAITVYRGPPASSSSSSSAAPSSCSSSTATN